MTVIDFNLADRQREPRGSTNPNPLQPDRDELERYVELVFRHADSSTFISIRAFNDNAKDDKPIFVEGVRLNNPKRLNRIVARAFEAAQKQGVFCILPGCSFDSPMYATAQNVANGLELSVETDERPKESLELLIPILGEPTITVASGGQWTDPDTGEIQDKIHAHWRLAVPTSSTLDHAKLHEARYLATHIVGADATNVPPVHPLRAPGSWHLKHTPRLARIVAVTENEIDLADALTKLRAAAPGVMFEAAPGGGNTGTNGAAPPPNGARNAFSDFADKVRFEAADPLDVVAALAVIPNADLSWRDWNRVAMATWRASAGQPFGYAAFVAWSSKSKKHNDRETAVRWQHISRHAPNRIGAGTLFYMAQEARPGWRKPSEQTRQQQDGPKPEGNAPNGSEQPNPGEDLGIKWHGETDDTPLKEWLVDRTLPKVGKAILAGQWGLYKTFVGFDLASSVMTMTPFAGRDVIRQGGVLFIACEGQDEVRVRLQGIASEKVKPANVMDVRIDPGKMPFAWIESCPSLTDSDSVPQIRKIVAIVAADMQARFGLPLALVIIDTMSAAAGFKDANDTSENQRVMGVLNALAIEFKALVLAVDHFGKDASVGVRNSSAKEAAADAVLAVLGDRDLAGTVSNQRMSIRKVRGAPTGEEIRFDVRCVEVGAEDRETKTNPFAALAQAPKPTTTLVIDWKASTKTADHATPARRQWPKSLIIFKRVLDASIGEFGRMTRPFPDGPEVRAVDRDKVRDEFMKAYPAENPKTKATAFQRSVKEAVSAAVMQSREVGPIERPQTVFWVLVEGGPT